MDQESRRLFTSISREIEDLVMKENATSIEVVLNYWKDRVLGTSRQGRGSDSHPVWYTEQHHNRAVVAKRILESFARVSRKHIQQREIYLPIQTMKITARSSGPLAAMTGEPARSPPQLSTASPGIKMRCGCQRLPWSLRYCCFDTM